MHGWRIATPSGASRHGIGTVRDVLDERTERIRQWIAPRLQIIPTLGPFPRPCSPDLVCSASYHLPKRARGIRIELSNVTWTFHIQVFSERSGALISTPKNQQVATSLVTEFLERMSILSIHGLLTSALDSDKLPPTLFLPPEGSS
jgi:hypothetical protein